MARADEEFYRRLAAEAGLAYVSLDEVPPDVEAARLVPAELARRFRVIPVAAGPGVLTLASARPHEHEVLSAVGVLTGRRVDLVVSTPGQIDDALRRAYGDPPLLRARRFEPTARRADDEDAARGRAADAGLPFEALHDLRAADPAVGKLFPERLCRALSAAPLRIARGTADIAVTDPLDPGAVRLLEVSSAHSVRQFVAPAERVAAALDHVFAVPTRMQARDWEPGLWRAHEPGRRLGEILVAAGALDRPALRAALAEQRRTGDPLGQVLAARGGLSQDRLAQTLAAQLRIPYLSPDELRPTAAAARALSDEFCRRHLVLPLDLVDGVLVVAMADPVDTHLAGALRAAARVPTRVVVASGTAIRAQLDRLHASRYAALATTDLLLRRPEESAYHTLSFGQRVVLAAVLILVFAGLALSWATTCIVLIVLSIAFYFAGAVFKLALVYNTMKAAEPEIPVSDTELALLDESSLPAYTILVPLFHEAAVVDQLIDGLRALDYPMTKLDIKLLLEEDDAATIAAVRARPLPHQFHVVIVPFGEPRTKPKACNFGLQHARGEHVVIFDAEDLPDPDQLKKAIVAFRKAPPDVFCVQAKLNYWNREQNLLTRWFTAEYSQWFDLFLPGLDAIGGPVPLGGTSNHFVTEMLLELGAWDPYNVTEDADVGIRLARAGFRTAIIDSTTYEEATSRVYNWIRQRSRWVKGYIQTWLVHMRHPALLWRELGPLRFMTFQLVVGGTFLTMLLNPLFWVLTSLWAVTEAGWLRQLFPGPVYFLASANLLLGNFIFTYLNVVGALRRGYHDLVRAALFSPLYWALMSIGAWKGFIQLLYRPSYWEKTVHGLAQPH